MNKNCFIALSVVTVFIFVSCVSVQGWEITESEQASVEVLGSVEVEFHSFQWFHIPGDKLIERAYRDLWWAAVMRYGSDTDIRNIEITSGFSGWGLIYIIAASTPFTFGGPHILGNIQKITATADVVRYDTGRREEINFPSFPPRKPTYVGFNANPVGLLFNGSSVCIEFTKGKFNSEINIIIPSGLVAGFNPGIGFLFTMNGFWPSRTGGFYLGGGGGYIWQKDSVYYKYNKDSIRDSHFLTWGLNLGYKFITNSGMYYRLGSYIGMGFDEGNHEMNYFYAKPDLTIGWTMR